MLLHSNVLFLRELVTATPIFILFTIYIIMKQSIKFYIAAGVAVVIGIALLASTNPKTHLLAIPPICVALTLIACAARAESKE